MGKFGCRLYCWGCGGCCLITGAVMGVMAAMVPPGMVAQLQEGLFDLAYIDDTSQTDAEGLLAEAGAPIAESDAFKAWGRAVSEGYKNCMKEDFPFDWDKEPEDCVDALHTYYFIYNVSNPDTWNPTGDSKTLLEVQEVGPFMTAKDSQKIEPDTAYWDETGKARWRIYQVYTNSRLCDAACEKFSLSAQVVTLNAWYGVFANLMLGDGWTVAHAVSAKGADVNAFPATLKAYLDATDVYPMDPHSALPLPLKTAARMIDFVTFLYTPNAPKLGAIELKQNLGTSEYTDLNKFLWGIGKKLLTDSAPAYGVPARVVPLLIKTTPNQMFGWGEMPAWLDPISFAPFTWNYAAGAAEYTSYTGKTESQFAEAKLSSVYYHEGLGYVTQHFETASGPTTANHSCGWDPDCGAGCYPTDNCKPQAAAGYDGGKIPGSYFGSPKGTAAAGWPQFENFVVAFYLIVTIKSTGRVVLPVKYKGPNHPEESELWDFEGWLVHSSFKSASWNRRIENCGGPVTLESGNTDSPGIDCNFVQNTSPLGPLVGLPMYWIIAIRDSAPPGWDPALTNADDGNSVTYQDQIKRASCTGNEYCGDALIDGAGPGALTFLAYGYEPNTGAMVDINLAGGVAWKQGFTPMHFDLKPKEGYQLMPLLWLWTYLHLPPAINMALSKLQAVPAAMNGFYAFLLAQCMISLIGGFACCFCGI